MKEPKLYIAETPAGASKAYIVGFKDDHKSGDNSRIRSKSIPEQPFRGFDSTEEVRLFLLEKFKDNESFLEWAAQCGNGSLLLKDISDWEEVLLPGARPSRMKKTKKKEKIATKRLAAKVEKIEEPDDDNEDDEDIEDAPLVKTKKRQPMRPLGIPIEIKEETAVNSFTYEQYKQVADGVVQQFENTLLSCMMYNVYLQPANLVHAYRALKLINVLQWTAALEAAKMAAIQDPTWTKFAESILNANRLVGLPV